MAERITSLQVAKRAGVSQAAVSRAFTPGASVSAKTAQKVKKAAQELGYRPNSLARAMVSGKSRIIGLVVAYLENYFYPEALEKLSNNLQAEGYHVMVFMAAQTSGTVDHIIDEILDYQVDGIIAASVALSSDLAERCRAAGVPIVFFNRTHSGPMASSVTSDNFAGGKAVAELFCQAGLKRCAYIAGWEGASTQVEREAGFRAGLALHGQEICAFGVGNFSQHEAANAARKIFDCADPPDAVFVANDHMAFAVMDVLRSELGFDVPHDVSVVGFDDVPPASWPAYALTSVRQRANKMVEETVRLMMEKIRNHQSDEQVLRIDAPLILRQSAKLPQGGFHGRV